LFGPPSGGKSHLAAALGFALVENGWRVLFTRTTDLVQRLQIARRELALEAAIAKLDKYHLLILDDLAYVTKDQAETSVLFELISARYERQSLLITANQPFGEWGKIFPDQAMTVAVVDRLVHHATIFDVAACLSIMPMPQRRKPILIVAVFPSRSLRYSSSVITSLVREALRLPPVRPAGRDS
jgi:DNA replication protein DnaC